MVLAPSREVLMPRGLSLEACGPRLEGQRLFRLRPLSSQALGRKKPDPPVDLLDMAQRFMGTTFPTGKECDLNRQCGVINPETKKICTRLLTCKVTPTPTAQ